MIDLWLKIKQFFCTHTVTYRNWKFTPGWTVTCTKCGKVRGR
jgi:hypothetical protein